MMVKLNTVLTTLAASLIGLATSGSEKTNSNPKEAKQDPPTLTQIFKKGAPTLQVASLAALPTLASYAVIPTQTGRDMFISAQGTIGYVADKLEDVEMLFRINGRLQTGQFDFRQSLPGR